MSELSRTYLNYQEVHFTLVSTHNKSR